MLRPALALALIGAVPALALAQDAPHFVRQPGRSAFGGDIPCPDNRLATAHDQDLVYRSTLAQVCGDDFPTTTCCTLGQLETLEASLAQAEPLLASCPACRNNFRRFYCAFTCSPDQSLFLAVTATQTLSKDGEQREGVKRVEFSVADEFGDGFFDSCKGVKFGATNGFAMDLIGGGATDWLSFLRYMGQERALGSPFEIAFPSPSSPPNASFPAPTPLSLPALSCASADPSARCACPDCPAVMDCFPFALCILYAAGLCAALGAYAAREAKRRWGSERARGAIYLGAEGDAEDEEGYDVPPRSAAAAAEDARGNTWARLRHRLSAVGWARPSRLEAGEADVAPLSEESVRSGSGVIGSVGGLVGAGSIASELEGGRARSGSGSTPSAGASRRSLQLSGASSSSAPGAALSLRDPPLDRAHTPDGGDGSALQPRSYALNTYLARAFHALGLSCARRPALTLALGLAACAVAHLGWARFAVEREPVALWVPEGSAVAREKARFDEAFGPFYRTEQVFFARLEGGDAPVLDWDTLEWLVSVEDDIRALRSANGAIALADVCFAPTSESGTASSAEECVVQSPLGYFSNSLASLSPDTWASALDACAASPAACLPPFGQPLNPSLVLSRTSPSAAAHAARAAIVTYVVRNSLDAGDVARAEAWEAALAGYLRALSAPGALAAQRGVKVSWSVGTSLEAELNAATNTDVPVVVLSYLVMFLYVAVALGGSASALARAAARAAGIVGAAGRRGARWVARRARGGAVKLTTGEGEHFAARSGADSAGKLGASVRKRLFVDSKFLLGLWGIVIVLLSVSTSVALCSAAGVKVTLIIAEVIPFLVLAIGVDNVFLLSHELDRQNARSYRHSDGALLLPGDDDSASSDLFLSVEERIARTLARVGPSILLSASCETVAFALGALVGMPAVRNFAVYAAGAVVVNALLQVTVFISLMTLDLHRVEANRVDWHAPFSRLRLLSADPSIAHSFPCFKLPVSPSLDVAPPSSESVLARFVRTVYAPNLVRKPVKFLVLALFSGLLVLSWIGARHIDLGLDQRLALPSSSYLVDYFNSVDAYLDVGPPVYFVAEGRNVTELANVQRFCSRFSACEDLSLANVLEAERKRPESSYLAEPPAVWIDDFISWTNPILEDCCRVKRRDSSQFCGPNDPEGACKPCFEDREPPWSTTLEGFPQGEEFMRYLEQWLASPTDESCPLGGKAGYSSALALREDGDGVELSHFRTYHTPLKTQDDFINAFAAARRIADDLSRRTGARVFPYSLFYVFFASYGELWATAREVLAFALGAVFLVTSLLLGSFRTGSVVAFTVFLSLVSVLGSMGAWGVSLNPLSLVNLVISIGIAVEFCAHLARAFMGALGGGVPFHHPAAKRDRDERAVAALEDVGASVVSGIGATKLIGIAVLGLTKSALLKTYYFKMWLALIVSSALHGLVLLPVLLSLFGGQGYALTTQDSDGGWIESSVQRRYERESRPFIDDDASSVDSGEY
ncbi:niemann-Pick type C-related protein 1 [Rhodotorula kratochvilovae]